MQLMGWLKPLKSQPSILTDQLSKLWVGEVQASLICCYLDLIPLVIMKNVPKNPAYGRHRISQPMLKEAPIQTKTFKDFSSSLNDLVKRGWAAVHSTSEPCSTFYPLNYTALLSYAVHFTEKF